MRHYTKEELERYRHHDMSVLGRINCSAHLEECDDCAKLLLEIAQDDSFVVELRDSLRIYKEAGKKTDSVGSK